MEHEALVKAIVGATTEVFGMMLSVEAVPGEAYTEQPSSEPTDGVIALLGLAGQWMGAGILQCDAAFAHTIYRQLLAVESPDADAAVNGEVLDAVAEVANMVIGNVKNVIEEALGPMGMSIPTVVFGRNFSTRAGGTDKWTVVPFDCGGSKLLVKIYLRHTPAAANNEIRRGFTLHRDFAI